jgi:hypothetical protein
MRQETIVLCIMLGGLLFMAVFGSSFWTGITILLLAAAVGNATFSNKPRR